MFDGVPLDTTGDISEPAEETEGLAARVRGSVFTPPRVENASDARLTFCVRPSAFRVDGGETRLTGEVLDNEFLGETTRVYIRWGGRQVAVSVDEPPDTETLTVGFDPEDAWVL